MSIVFITKIQIEKVRHLQNVSILLSESERKHLIITGKNGSGKTSLLEDMSYNIAYERHKHTLGGARRLNIIKARKSKIEITYSHAITDYSNFTFAYIPARRSELELPKSIERMEISDKTSIEENISKVFLKHILNLDFQLYGAKSDNDEELTKNLELWFKRFETTLREIYSCDELKLKRNAKEFLYMIDMPDREPFSLHEQAAGYAALLNIYMELLMRFERENAVVEYDTPAIVMIDEIETGLHVELQKRALPFLTKMFPNVQFIVATHSPFIISSLKNAIVFDLETKRRVDDLYTYSWETIVESYFDINQYSLEIENKFNRYKELCMKEQRSRTEEKEFSQLRAELSLVSPAQKELYNAFLQLETQRKQGALSG